jgi:hypothetical protein
MDWIREIHRFAIVIANHLKDAVRQEDGGCLPLDRKSEWIADPAGGMNHQSGRARDVR